MLPPIARPTSSQYISGYVALLEQPEAVMAWFNIKTLHLEPIVESNEAVTDPKLSDLNQSCRMEDILPVGGGTESSWQDSGFSDLVGQSTYMQFKQQL